MEREYQYILVHRSLKDYPGALACQVAHAVSMLPAPGAWAAALVVETAQKLMDLGEALGELGVECYLMAEPDPPYNGSPTVLVTVAVEKKRVANLLSELALL
jgi:hypothetical protein